MLLNIGNNLGKKLTIKNPNQIFIVGLLNHTNRTLHPYANNPYYSIFLLTNGRKKWQVNSLNFQV